MSLLFNVESEEELGFRLGMMWAQAKEAEDMQEPGGLSPHTSVSGRRGFVGFVMVMANRVLPGWYLQNSNERSKQPRETLTNSQRPGLRSVLRMMITVLSAFTGIPLCARCFIFNVSSKSHNTL